MREEASYGVSVRFPCPLKHVIARFRWTKVLDHNSFGTFQIKNSAAFSDVSFVPWWCIAFQEIMSLNMALSLQGSGPQVHTAGA